MKRNTTDIVDIKRGESPIQKIFRETTLVWQRVEPSVGFPDWDENNVNGSLYLNALSDFTSTASFDDTTQATFGNLGTGGDRWFGNVLAPNGDIFCMPLGSAQILRINVQDNTTTLFGSLSGSARFIGGVLAPNGFIYASPYNAGYFMKINPETNQISTFGSKPTNSRHVMNIVAPNGKIYYCPIESNLTIRVIDPTNDSITSFDYPSGLTNTTTPYSGMILAPNGNIYFTPGSNDRMAKLDPNTNTITYFGSLTPVPNGTNRYDSAILAPNGKIYMLPGPGINNVLIFNPDTENISYINLAANGPSSCSSVLAPDGNIYFTTSLTNISKIDTSTDTLITNVFTLPGKSVGFALSLMGQFYTTPTDTSTITKVGAPQTLDPNFPLARYINKR